MLERVAWRAFPQEFRSRFDGELVASSEESDEDYEPPTRNISNLANIVGNGWRMRAKQRRQQLRAPTSVASFGRWVMVAATIAFVWKSGAFALPGSSGLDWFRFDEWKRGPLLQQNTPTGGDMGAHVWTPDVLRREILPSGRLIGWSDDWFGGMPVLQFYFPLPMYLIVALSLVLPSGIAFKLVTIAGSVALPWCAKRTMRYFGASEVLSTIAGLAMFVFILGRYYDWTGYGGTIFSTMSGEFSFSFAVALAVLFIGKFAYLMRTGRGRVGTGVVLAATGLSHLLPTIWALTAAIIIGVISIDRARWRRQFVDALAVGALGGGLAAFWLIPFATNLPYTNDMGWDRKRDFAQSLFPFLGAKPFADSAIIGVASAFALIGAIYAVGSLLRVSKPAVGVEPHHWIGIAIVVLPLVLGYSIWRGAVLAAVFVLVLAAGVTASMRGQKFDRLGMILTLLAGACAVTFVELPQFRLWNARVLPFWFLSVLLLAAVGAVRATELVGVGVQWLSRGHARVLPASARGHLGIASAAGSVFVAVGLPLGMMPSALPIPKVRAGMVGVQQARGTTDRSGASVWTKHNYDGYEGASGWPEYQGLMATAQTLGQQRGCGRAMWEYDSATIEKYGTTLALTLLPYWTKGCIGSMEGVYFESSASAPAHWINAALVSAPRTDAADGSPALSGPSNPQRGLAYPSFDLERGITKLRELGVRYYMAFSPIAVTAARTSTQLVEVAQSPSIDPASKALRTVWHFYEIRDYALVAPLTEQPVVVRGVGQSMTDGWLDAAMAAYAAPDAKYPKTLAADGPANWERTDVTIVKRLGEKTYGTGVHFTGPQTRAKLKTIRSCLRIAVKTAPIPPVLAPPSSTQITANGLRRGTTPRTRDEVPAKPCPNTDSEALRIAPQQPSVPTTKVSNIRMSSGKISFDVDRVNTPVVVRTSYFPNWKAKGAKGPYRTMPNLMTVIPIGRRVTLTYGLSRSDEVGYAASLLSILAVVGANPVRRLRRRKRVPLA
jgi:hypothetical protein